MRLTIPSALLALTVLAGDAAPARAQLPPAEPPADPPALADKSLEDLMSVEVGTVFGAARREQRVTEAPSSVTIVTAEDIRTFGWRTLAEALSSVRGFYVTNDRNYTYVGVRGFGRPSDYNNRVLVLVNGHRYNDNVYDQALLGHEFPIDLVARRSHRSDPRTRLGALRHQRVLRGHQRGAAAGRGGRRQ